MKMVRGRVSATIKAPLSAAWSVASDFFSLHRWVPSIQECYEIERNVRFCRSYPDARGLSISVKEELIYLDNWSHSLAYKIVDGNMGLEDYTATMKLTALGEGCCLIEWSFTMSSSSSKSKQAQEEFLAYGIRNLEKAAMGS
ncbi:hypothetical protein SELMODRAFT_418358 [Selaginella moellendorffii]|uniref:Bet v I/Major latex protein domain-containing protein n=1 Tax=Selaginella moellendorffii TaxID=88036 RepID=D8S5G6_SELML|nr:hypothetical protein SELMODRAFT_418358 [Selaginella moellendorffii]